MNPQLAASLRPEVRVTGARGLLPRGERYSLPAYVLGSLLRLRCHTAGAVARLRGRPGPRLEPRGGEIHLGHDVGLYPGVRLSCQPGARITVGDGTYLNRRTLVHAEQEVVLGAGCMVAWDVVITDTQGFGDRPGTGDVKPVHVGDGAWIGAKAVLLAGADVGAGAVVAAGAVVDGPVDPGEIVAAKPARTVFVLPGGTDG